jgi:hypothetical protein
MTKNNNGVQAYQIVYPPGASGHFLKNFLNTELPDIEISRWAQDVSPVECSYLMVGHNKKIRLHEKYIGIIPENLDDLIKITINRFLKSNRIYQTEEFDITSNKFLDKIFMSASRCLVDSDFNYDLDIFSTDFDICIFYNQIFKIEDLEDLYHKINGIDASNVKLEFAKKYIDYHRDFYQTPYYTSLHAILKFEYEHQLFEKTRSWTIDSINLTDIEVCKENLKNFLNKENYL